MLDGRTLIAALESALRSEVATIAFDEPLLTVEAVAAAAGIAPRQVGKAMGLVCGPEDFAIAVLGGDQRLSLRAARQLLGVHAVELIPPDDIARSLGVPRGAVTPLVRLVRPTVRVAFDSALTEERLVNISSGDPTLSVNVEPTALVGALGGSVGRLARR